MRDFTIRFTMANHSSLEERLQSIPLPVAVSDVMAFVRHDCHSDIPPHKIIEMTILPSGLVKWQYPEVESML